MIAYLARDIPAFVMYCVNGASRSPLLIESTDSMIIYVSLFPGVVLYARDCSCTYMYICMCDLPVL